MLQVPVDKLDEADTLAALARRRKELEQVHKEIEQSDAYEKDFKQYILQMRIYKNTLTTRVDELEERLREFDAKRYPGQRQVARGFAHLRKFGRKTPLINLWSKTQNTDRDIPGKPIKPKVPSFSKLNILW